VLKVIKILVVVYKFINPKHRVIITTNTYLESSKVEKCSSLKIFNLSNAAHLISQYITLLPFFYRVKSAI